MSQKIQKGQQQSDELLVNQEKQTLQIQQLFNESAELVISNSANPNSQQLFSERQTHKNENSNCIRELQAQIKEKDQTLAEYQNILQQNLNMKFQLCSLSAIIEELKKTLMDKDQQIYYLQNVIGQNNIKIEQKILQIQIYRNKQLEYAQKQQKMRDNLVILQQESKKIFQEIKIKQEVEEQQYKKLQEQQITINSLRDKLHHFQAEYKIKLQLQKDNYQYQLQIQKLIIQNQENLLKKIQLYKEFTKKINILEEKLKKQQQKNKQIQENKITLEKQLLSPVSSNKEIKVLQSILAQKQIEIQCLEKQIILKNKKIEGFQQMEIALNIQQNEILKLQQQMQVIRENNHTKNYDLQCLKQQNKILKNKIINLQKQIITKQNQIIFLNENIEKLKKTQSPRKSFKGLLAPPQLIIQTDRNILEQKIVKLMAQLANAMQTIDEKQNLIEIMTIQAEKNREAAQQIIQIKDNIKKLPILVDQIKNHLDQRQNSKNIQRVFQLLNQKIYSNRIQQFRQERGIMQQKARSLSMEYQKLKAFILKSNKKSQQKLQLITVIKSSEKIINQIVQISQTLSEHLALQQYRY